VFDPALLAAFTHARWHAMAHMQHCLAEGYGDWREDTVTDILCQHASPVVKSVRFNARQEGMNGIDYLLWWRDRSGQHDEFNFSINLPLSDAPIPYIRATLVRLSRTQHQRNRAA
jgi:hypothetical protein